MQHKDQGLRRIGAALLGVAGASMWAFSRLDWIVAEYTDDISGGGSAAVQGAQWSTEVTAVAILLIAGMAAGLALRRTARRVVGAVSAVVAAVAVVPVASLLIRGADTERVHAILSAGADEAQSAASQADIAQWAEITSTTVQSLGPVLSLLGCLLGVAGGVMLAARPGVDAPRSNKYEKETVRMEKVRTDLEEDPASGRVLWDAISADIDPTDTADVPRAGGDFPSR